MYNEFTSITISVDNQDHAKIKITEALGAIVMIYSWALIIKNKAYSLKCVISSIDDFNTLSVNKMIDKVQQVLQDPSDSKYMLAFEQAPLDIIIKVYEPYYTKLCQSILQKWNKFEFEDLYQTCILNVAKLYRGGYYIHKALIKRSFYSDVLYSIRPEKGYNFISLNQPMHENSEGDILTLESMLPDVSADDFFDNFYKEQDRDIAFKKIKEICGNSVSERQWTQLLFEYGTNNVSMASSRKVQQIRGKLKKAGVL